ncbi:MAG: hypothetical protein E7001_07770 [Coriobacteriaceae bacterium]|nr:hypothetical protein [Coriobacteriaceae bacterium]
MDDQFPHFDWIDRFTWELRACSTGVSITFSRTPSDFLRYLVSSFIGQRVDCEGATGSARFDDSFGSELGRLFENGLISPPSLARLTGFSESEIRDIASGKMRGTSEYAKAATLLGIVDLLSGEES